jgi:nucleotide-binding universal stress UspA family protein
LIAYPILSRLGLVRNEAIAMVVGATVFTDISSLLVLAVVAGTRGGDVSAFSIIKLIALMIGYALLVLLGLPRLGKFFFRRYSSRDIEFQFVLVALFVAAVLAEQIGMHAIVGAFLAGLAISATLPGHSAVGGQILFLGQSFFIPMFMIYVGMSVDPLAFVVNLETLLIGVAMTAAVYVTKFVAAWITARLFDYTRNELLAFWGLSQAQAAATIATILVGQEIGLFSETVFNGSILAIMCTCITSPLLVERFGKHIRIPPAPEEEKPLFERILVPIANPQTQEHLLTLANILSRTVKGTLLPLHVAQEIDGRIEGLEQQHRLLEKVPEILEDPETEIELVQRVDTSIAQGILHAAIETEATLIVMGWRGKPTFRQSIFGTVLDQVIWSANVPVVVGRMITPINATQRVILVLPSRSLDFGLIGRTVEMVTSIAQAINVPLLILTDPRYQPRLQVRLDELELDLSCQVALLGDNAVRGVTREAGEQDLVVVATTGSERRFRSSLGHLPEQLARTLSGSMVVVRYPQ